MILGGKNNVFDSLNIKDINEKIRLKEQQIEILENDILIVGYI